LQENTRGYSGDEGNCKVLGNRNVENGEREGWRVDFWDLKFGLDYMGKESYL
jgi:hypothetical protein